MFVQKNSTWARRRARLSAGLGSAALAAALLSAAGATPASGALITSFSAGVLNDENVANPQSSDYFTQAGGNPDVAFTKFTLNASAGAAEFVRVDLPAGLAVNPQATPRCSAATVNACPANTQVGTTHVTIANIPLIGKETVRQGLQHDPGSRPPVGLRLRSDGRTAVRGSHRPRWRGPLLPLGRAPRRLRQLLDDQRHQQPARLPARKVRTGLLPDVPLSHFTLSLPMGPYSALGAGGELCGEKLTMSTTLVAQNGARLARHTQVAVTGCPGGGQGRSAAAALSGCASPPRASPPPRAVRACSRGRRAPSAATGAGAGARRARWSPTRTPLRGP